jgi:hypothetical protein
LAFTMQNYHSGDVNLFWEDIRENALLRVQRFRSNKKNSNQAKSGNSN